MSDDRVAQEEASIRGLLVGVVVHHALEDLRGRRDLGFGRLQDGTLSRPGPGGKCLAEIAVVGSSDGTVWLCRSASRSANVRRLAPRSSSHWPICVVFSPAVSVSSARWALVAGAGSADRNGA
jgi:hypothetical protein